MCISSNIKIPNNAGDIVKGRVLKDGGNANNSVYMHTFLNKYILAYHTSYQYNNQFINYRINI